MDRDKVISNIKAMLNLANNEAASQGEIDNAMRFVARLMEQHQLSDDDINAVDNKLLDLERAEMAHQQCYYNGHKLSEWEGSVASYVCELVGGVKCYVNAEQPYRVNGIVQYHPKPYSHKPMLKPIVTFYGVAEDAEIARLLFAEITTTIATMAKLKWGAIFRGNGREYCTGFAQGLWTKLYRDRDVQRQKALTASSGSTALVAIDNRALIVKKKEELAVAYREETLGIKKLRKGSNFSGNRKGSHEARAEGREDGQRHNVEATRRKKLSGPNG